MPLLFDKVCFTYEGAAAALLEGVTAHFMPGWTGVVGANGSGKTTLLRLAAGELQPQRGSVQAPGSVVYCPQRTDQPPTLFREFLAATSGDACGLRGRLRVEDAWAGRWETLSHGERKRAQIGVALWQAPAVLLLDEPTNHIDADARDLLAGVLRAFRGIGLLVSHDRDLLDLLCGQCLFLEPPRVRMRLGGYTAASAQARLEGERAREERRQAKDALARVEREAERRHREASRADRKRSKRALDPRDHDAKRKIDLARVTGADGKAGRLASQLDGRVEQAREAVERAAVTKEYRLGIWLPGSRSPRDALLHVAPGRLPLGEGRTLSHPELHMAPGDRVAVTGPNGAGKSTLVRHLLDRLNLPAERLTYVPQEIDADASRRILADVLRLNGAELGHLMTVVSCLGSRPERLLESAEPSPGELRKLLLALGIARSPHLIVMDEPTNHLDLPAIECLEDALADCPCGLLLVSHDLRFLRRLARTRWHITPGHLGNTCLQITDP